MKDYKKILYTLLYESLSAEPATPRVDKRTFAEKMAEKLSRTLSSRLPPTNRETSTATPAPELTSELPEKYAPPPEAGPSNPNVVGANGKTYAQKMAADERKLPEAPPETPERKTRRDMAIAKMEAQNAYETRVASGDGSHESNRLASNERRLALLKLK